MNQSATITRRFSQAIVQAAERLKVSLPAEVVSGLEGRERIHLDDQDRLWEAFCTAADDPLAGLRLGLEVQVGHLDSVGMLLMSCDNLGEAVDMLLEYAPIVGDAADFRFYRQDSVAVLEYLPRYRARRAERVEAVLACLLNMTRWTTGNAFRPDAVELGHRQRAEPDQYRALLDCPVYFNRPGNCLRFSEEQLALPLIQANGTLREHLRSLADQTLKDLGRQSFGARLEGLIHQHPDWGRERIAAQLAMSGRHLNRKLADQGTSFKTLREQLLFQLAGDALENGAAPATLSGQLGFSDESAFARAFKRWSGMTPSQFRQASRRG